MNDVFPKRFVLMLALVLPGAIVASEPVRGVCRQQIADYVEHRLGQTVTNIDIRNYTYRERVVDHGDALVYVKECSGFHAFEVYGTETVCEDIPHYGHPGNYVRYQEAHGGCKKPG